ncbi:hypothetical protein [Methylophilus sp. YYY-1]|uniref:hypothetical protein n=1 Tax=Methylophilus sp. YYY-1 TaxID=2682087 RepID=UPI0023B28CCB|nr:hypothetical protein [Methylophilus sp. YYY-1]MDF0378602.1 hypothetical protein [Methylophilus sp. YYY-1]
MKGKDLTGLSRLLTQRLSVIKNEFVAVDDNLDNDFLENCRVRRRELEASWNADWKTECDGKKLFSDLGQRIKLKQGSRKLKLKVMNEMRSNSSENGKVLEKLIYELINGES